MTPKEKAEELLEKMHKCLFSDGLYDAKQCSMVAVEEVVDQWDYIDTYLGDGRGELNPNLRWWQEVKKELEKL